MIERLLAVAVIAAGVVYLTTAWALPFGSAARPGSGFYPLAVAVFGVAVAVVWLVSALRAPAGVTGRDDDAVSPGGYRRVLASAALLVGFCLGLPWVGYPLAAFGFVTALLRALGSRWLTAAAIGVASAAASYYLFGPLLGVPLPRGLLLD